MNDPCPHCGYHSYGPVLDGFVHVCPDCGYDTEHGMTGVCPGGKHPKDSDNVCCDFCWDRIPTRLPGMARPWRTGLRDARAIRAWGQIETILTANKAWLSDHPKEPTR